MPSRMLAQGLFNANDEERWLVSHIRASRGEVVAAVGGRILAWKVGSEVKKSKGKGAGAGRLSARSERFRCEFSVPRPLVRLVDCSSLHQPTSSCDKRSENRSTRSLRSSPIASSDSAKNRG